MRLNREATERTTSRLASSMTGLMPCPFSTALGYNQLLNTHSVELMAEKGDQFLTALTRKSASLRGEARKALDRKIEVLRRMIEFARSVPDD